jgi:hypothetical protein
VLLRRFSDQMTEVGLIRSNLFRDVAQRAEGVKSCNKLYYVQLQVVQYRQSGINAAAGTATFQLRNNEIEPFRRRRQQAQEKGERRRDQNCCQSSSTRYTQSFWALVIWGPRGPLPGKRQQSIFMNDLVCVQFCISFQHNKKGVALSPAYDYCYS